MNTSARLMLVDDEPNILSALVRLLRNARYGSDRQYEIECFTRSDAALGRAEEKGFDLILSDLRMPEMDGIAFLAAVRELQPNTPRLIMSGQADLQTVINAVNIAGIVRFIAKPWHEVELFLAIENALGERRLLEENRRLADEVRVQRKLISRHEAELRRLELESPGITRVNWGADGSMIAS